MHADDEVRALAVGDLEDARAHAVGGRRARLEVGGDHLRRADAERVEELEHVVAQLVVVADLDRRQVQALVEAGRGRDRHAARLDRARLGRVVGRARPGDQLAVVEDRQHDHLVGVVDAAVERVVGEPDVAVLDARVLAVVLEDVLDQDRLDDRVQVRARGGVDQVAVGA